jgi:hypothetical protein
MKTLEKYAVTFLLLIFFINGNAQIFTPKWETCLGGTEWDEATGILFSDSSYWVVTQTKSNDGDISFNHGTYDIWFANVNLQGELITEKTFGGSYADALFIDIKAKNDSVFYIAAWSQSVDGDISNNPWPGANGNLWVLQINRQGDILWETMAGGSGTDELRDMLVTDDGGILLLGLTSSHDGDVNDHHGSYDLWLIKIDGSGQKRWSKSFGCPGQEEGGSVIQTEDGGYMIAGATDGYAGGNYDTTCNHHNPASGFPDVWLVKIDSAQNIEWQQCYGGYYYDFASNVLEQPDGYIVLAHTMSNDGDVSGYHSIPGPNSQYGGDIWVFKIDKTGNLLWQRCLGGTYDDFARNIFPTSDGGYMIVGETRSEDGDVEGFGGNAGYYSDVWFTKIDSTGNLLWQYCYGGPGNDYLYRGVIQKSDWDYVLAMSTNTDDWQCYYGAYPDVRVVELYDSTVGITEEVRPVEDERVKVFPNPANNTVTFSYTLPEDAGNGVIELFDNTGKNIKHIIIKSSNSQTVNCSAMPQGVYFYRFITETSVSKGKFVVQHEY